MWYKKNLLNNKVAKGYSLTSFVYFLLIVIPISILILAYFFFLGMNVFDSLSPIGDDVEESLLIARLTNVCLRYDDGMGVSYGNILDIQKFNKDVLDGCFLNDNVRIRLQTIFLERDDISIPILSTGVAKGTSYDHYSLMLLEDGTLTPVKLIFIIG